MLIVFTFNLEILLGFFLCLGFRFTSSFLFGFGRFILDYKILVKIGNGLTPFFEVFSQFLLHASLTGPNDTIRRTVLDRGRSTCTMDGNTLDWKAKVGRLNTKNINNFLNMLNGFTTSISHTTIQVFLFFLKGFKGLLEVVVHN